MANTLELPESARNIIAEKISHQLRRSASSDTFDDDVGGGPEGETETAPLVEVGDRYFAVYSLEVQDPARLRGARGDLGTLVTEAHSWHHQVTFADGGKGFALTNLAGASGEEWPLSGFFESSIARSIDKAVDLAHQTISNTANARLLLAPAHQVTALWFCKETGGSDDCTGETQLLIVQAPSRITRLNFGQAVGSSAFLDALAESGPISGFSPTAEI